MLAVGWRLGERHEQDIDSGSQLIDCVSFIRSTRNRFEHGISAV